MGGLKGSGCRWLWGMKSLNRSLTSPTEPVPVNWPWGGKKKVYVYATTLPRGVRLKVGLRTPVGTQGDYVCVGVCGQWG